MPAQFHLIVRNRFAFWIEKGSLCVYDCFLHVDDIVPLLVGPYARRGIANSSDHHPRGWISDANQICQSSDKSTVLYFRVFNKLIQAHKFDIFICHLFNIAKGAYFTLLLLLFEPFVLLKRRMPHHEVFVLDLLIVVKRDTFCCFEFFLGSVFRST